MEKELLQVRIDSKVKREAGKVFSSLGMDLSTGVRIFLNQVIFKKGIPFSILTENGFTKKHEDKMLRGVEDVKEKHKNGKRKGFQTTEELFNDLLK